jgi:DNA polymerase
LKRRLQEGETTVYLTDETLAWLQDHTRRASPAGRDSWTPESTPPPHPRAEGVRQIPPAPAIQLPEGSKLERLQALRNLVEGDPWCRSQVKPGKQVVFGVGTPEARIFFCGEAPGAEEEIQGEPFVGPAGRLLTRIIETMGLSREAVYIANIMNYRPPMPGPVGNRPPTAEEMRYCLPFLKEQVAIVEPEVIVALGKTAVDGLLGPDPKRRMGAIRGQWMDFQGVPLMPTFHPSYLLRNTALATKRQVWEDMLGVMERLGMAISARQRGFFMKDR